MSPTTTLAVVICILSVSAAVVLVAAIRAVVEVVRVRAGADRLSPGKMKP